MSRYLIDETTSAVTKSFQLKAGQTISITGAVAAHTVALKHIDPNNTVIGDVVDPATGVALILSASYPAHAVNSNFRIQIVKGVTTGAVGIFLDTE